MTTSPADGGQHRLVRAYLADLDRALLGADPQERAETLAAVRDHIADALGVPPGPTDERVRRVLAELGPVDRIAEAATPAVVVPEGPGARGWTAPVLLVAAVVSLALVVVVPWLAVAIAVGCLVGAVVAMRRRRGDRGLLWAVVVVSGLTLATVAVVSALLLATTSPGDQPAGGVETAQPAG